MPGRLVSVVLGLAAAAATLIPIPVAQAQDYPTRPVKLLVGFPPGNTTDVVARILAEALRTRLGQPVVVENKTGASGMLAAEAVARAVPDGYTVLVSNTGSIVVSPVLHPDRYNPEKDFAPVTTVVAQPMVLLVNPSNPRTASVKSFQDLVTLAKARPGVITYGSAGIGNMLHLAGAQLGAAMDLQMIHIPYRGGAQMQTALLGGEIDFTFDTLTAMPHIKAGKLRALAVTAATRWPDLPDVPAMASELGVPSLDLSLWTGILLPGGTPDKIVDLLHREITAVMQEPRFRDLLLKQGSVAPKSPQAFRAKIRAELQQNAVLVKRLDIKAE
jgi:tripartite-type tricarboxylate transporter receptor subunit TctC